MCINFEQLDDPDRKMEAEVSSHSQLWRVFFFRAIWCTFSLNDSKNCYYDLKFISDTKQGYRYKKVAFDTDFKSFIHIDQQKL
jgi:hypothetical protein